MNISIFGRLPKDDELKNQWVEAIREANNDNYSGSGLVCQNHFEPEEIRGEGPRAQLVKGSVPSVFFVECIEAPDELQDIGECNECSHMKSDIENINVKIMRMALDSQIIEAKLQKKIEELQCSLDAKTQGTYKLKKQLKMAEIENDTLRNNLLALKTTSNVNVKSICYFMNIFFIPFEHVYNFNVLFFPCFRSTARKN